MYQFHAKAYILWSPSIIFMKAVKSCEIQQLETAILTKPILNRVGH